MRRSSRAFNPATATALALFAAVLRGEHTLQGFRNRDVLTRLLGPTPMTDRRRKAQVSPSSTGFTCAVWSRRSRSRRSRITLLGHTVMSAAIHLREEAFPTPSSRPPRDTAQISARCREPGWKTIYLPAVSPTRECSPGEGSSAPLHPSLRV